MVSRTIRLSGWAYSRISRAMTRSVRSISVPAWIRRIRAIRWFWLIGFGDVGTRAGRWSLGRAGFARPTVGTAGCLAPVSYTHLRAHETVLDLVCRLLLEK